MSDSLFKKLFYVGFVFLIACAVFAAVITVRTDQNRHTITQNTPGP